ncbi:MAG: HlyD family efflux transporter periplasmic adaptor subunit [Holophagales bacterium]|nr:HlyD family efflux transporter periplasmic adaptor subunit [Holophagales bacterium]
MLDFELADAGRRLDRQRLVVTELERRVDELVIRTPFDGLVATVAAEDRDVLARGQPVLGVVDLSDLELEVAIPEAYAGEALPGIPAVVRVGETEVPGRLVRVAPEVRQGQVEGRVAFDRGPPEGLRQNQRLSTRLVLDRRADVLRVRRGPFLESLGGRQAYAVEGDLATLRNIRLGAVSVTEVEILEGVEAGEELVISDLSRFDGATTLLLRD